MTNEEAITRLKGLYGNGYMEQEQALDMAIKALKQTDGDLISRQAVLDKLQEHHDFYINAYGDRFDFRDLAQKDDKARVDEITTIQAFIMELPTIPQTDSVLEDIKAEIKQKLQEPQYQHEDEDWRCGLIIAEEIFDKHISGKKGD